MIKAIETRYAGCRFRSRLEARWAVFFNQAEIPWLYEPQGFVIDGKPYLPDFFLPECGTWVEVKGEPQGAAGLDLLERAGQQLPIPQPGHGERGPALMLVGPIPNLTEGRWWGYNDITWASFPSHLCGYGFGLYPKNRRPWWLSTRPAAGDLHAFDPDEYMLEQIADAYRAARSARFEHGEGG